MKNNLDPIVIKFDWNDDHSKFRIEEIGDLLNEIEALLGSKISVESIYELEEVCKPLRYLYQNKMMDDKMARRSIEIHDEIKSIISSSEYDAVLEYEDTLALITEKLEDYNKEFIWIYSLGDEAEFNIDLVKYFKNLLNSRHGLGDRFVVEFDSKWIEMPNGERIYLHNPSDAENNLFNIYYNSDIDEEKYSMVAHWVANLPNNTKLKIISEISEIITGQLYDEGHDFLKDITENYLNEVEKVVNCKEFDYERYLTFLKKIGCEWDQGLEELVKSVNILALHD